MAYSKIGGTKEALDCYDRVLKIKLRVLGMNHESYAETLNSIGAVYLNIGEY